MENPSEKIAIFRILQGVPIGVCLGILLGVDSGVPLRGCRNAGVFRDLIRGPFGDMLTGPLKGRNGGGGCLGI